METLYHWSKKMLLLPEVASRHGHEVDKLMVFVHYLMAALFAGWILYFGYVLWRFRAKRHPEADHAGVKSHASTWLEVAVAGVEAVLLLGFAVPLWASVVDDFPNEKESTVVRVVAEQFGWNFVYPGPDGKFGRQGLQFVTGENPFGFDKADPDTKDNVSVLNDLHLPVNKPAILHISSKDVIHSFKVVPLRVCQDAIPGISIPTHFVPTSEGKYQVICAQLCGNGHAAMANGVVSVVSEDGFKEWLGSKAGAAASFE